MLFRLLMTLILLALPTASFADKYQMPLPDFEGQTSHEAQPCYVDFGNLYRNINGVWVMQIYEFGVNEVAYEIQLRAHLFSVPGNLFRGKSHANETAVAATEFELEVKLSPEKKVLAVAGSTQDVRFNEAGESTPTGDRKLFICLPKE